MATVTNVFYLLLVVVSNNYAFASECESEKIKYSVDNWTANTNNSADRIYFVNITSRLPILCNNFSKTIAFATHLYVEGVFLKEFENGSLNTLENLQMLSAKTNDIESLKKREFYNLKLVKITLSNNKLQTIQSNTFEKLPQLEDLNLSNNLLTTLEKDWFIDCDKLIRIRLYYNKIKKIDGNMFNNVNPQNYMNILMGSNQIEEIDNEAFAKMSHISELTLHENLIKEFNENLLEKAKDVLLLDLGNNKIQCVSEKLLNKCGSIFLVGNNFKEECIQVLDDVKEKNPHKVFWKKPETP